MEAAAVAFSGLPRGCHDGDSDGWVSLDRKYVSVMPSFSPLWGIAQSSVSPLACVVAMEASSLKPFPCPGRLVRGWPRSLRHGLSLDISTLGTESPHRGLCRC